MPGMNQKQRRAINGVLIPLSNKRLPLQDFLDQAVEPFRVLDVLGDESYKPLLSAVEGIYCGEAGESRVFIDAWQCWLTLQWHYGKVEVAYLS